MRKINKYIKDNRKMIILLGISLFLFILLSLSVINDRVNLIDTLVHSYILDIRNNGVTSIITVITNLAGASFLLALSAILLLIMRKKKIPLYILINLSSAFLLNEIVKVIFSRSRPVGINLIEETGYSFPSGHSMVAMSFYGFIVYLLYKNMKNKTYKWLSMIGLSILIFLVGFSRIYLGVHYISDVIGGFLLSLIYLILFINIYNKKEKM